ncbi:hypothetical protein EW146_g3413 [Bondarzewia mesenterica]|uniref:SWIM-type domain-containing protein n=1 Tax=Bondarzewia mesenterica TaxID=1095465 RepID=A0A4S4LXZ8_9AGAM|nr:hypothetical protein EW146_g3413 [Bondarzewia mesenterica]
MSKRKAYEYDYGYEDLSEWLPPRLPKSHKYSATSAYGSSYDGYYGGSYNYSAAGPSSAGEIIDLTAPPKPKRQRTVKDPDASYNYSAAGPSLAGEIIDLTALPKPKRQRKVKDPDAAPQEKRGAIFKKKCPKNILERVERVMTQRFFMVDRKREGNALREEFSVLGSTGNVYTVIIDKKPSCSCPDHLKGNHCKHILFIFLKVLQVTQSSGYWYQKALLTSELETIFAQAPLAPNALAHPRIRDAYARATGKATPSSSADAGRKKKRIPGPDDDCPICYDGMHGVNEKQLTFCDECGNAVHNECFQQWAKTSGANVTCVWCRAKWMTAAPAGSSARRGGVRTSEGYLNLGRTAGLSPVRDTSSYYHGPRRGQSYYGYQEYADYY